MRNRCKQGLTLVEVLVTLGLMAIIIQITATLMTNVSKTNTRHQSGERLVSSLQGFNRMRQEALQAVSIQSPSSSNFVTKFEFQRIAPHSDRLPSVPEEWNPKLAESLISVRYTLHEDRLIREETLPSGEASETVIANDVDSFFASQDIDGVLEFRFSFRVGKVIQPYTIKVARLIP